MGFGSIISCVILFCRCFLGFFLLCVGIKYGILFVVCGNIMLYGDGN